MKEWVIRWQPSPIVGRWLAFFFAPEDGRAAEDGPAPVGLLTLTLEQARELHEEWTGKQEGWDDGNRSA